MRKLSLCAVISFVLSLSDNLTKGFSLCVFHIFGGASLAFAAIIPFQVFYKIYPGLISPDPLFLPDLSLSLRRRVGPAF